jgi:hypothetical protein
VSRAQAVVRTRSSALGIQLIPEKMDNKYLMMTHIGARRPHQKPENNRREQALSKQLDIRLAAA